MDDLDPLPAVTATVTEWLLRSFPAPAGAVNQALARAQAQQAAGVAAALRFPTPLDRELLALTGPCGPEDEPWLDETVLSWAAALLADPALARRAAAAAGLSPSAHRRLTMPGPRDRAAAALLRHPDLLDATAMPHRTQLQAAIDRGPQEAQTA